MSYDIDFMQHSPKRMMNGKFSANLAPFYATHALWNGCAFMQCNSIFPIEFSFFAICCKNEISLRGWLLWEMCKILFMQISLHCSAFKFILKNLHEKYFSNCATADYDENFSIIKINFYFLKRRREMWYFWIWWMSLRGFL
jgi:hypothetical protein